jgi:hypothetical protein
MKYLQMGTDCYKATDNNAIANAIKSFIIYQQGNLSTLKVYDAPASAIEWEIMEMDLDRIFTQCSMSSYETVYWSKDNNEFRQIYSHNFMTSDGGWDSHDWYNTITWSEALEILRKRKFSEWLLADVDSRIDIVMSNMTTDEWSELTSYVNDNELYIIYDALNEFSNVFAEDDDRWETFGELSSFISRRMSN